MSKKRGTLKRGFCDKTQTQRTVLNTAVALWTSLDTPISLSCVILARYGEYEQLAAKKIDPLNYRSPWSFQRDYAAVNFVRKFPSLPMKVDRKANALRKFNDAEARCADTNHLLRCQGARLVSPLDNRILSVISRARMKIAKVLGPLTSDVLNEAAEEMRWGPGATSAKGDRGDTSAFQKFDACPESTLGCFNHAWAAIMSVPSWDRAYRDRFGLSLILDPLAHWKFIPGGRVTTVPKDALVDRVIAVEPHMNQFVQLGFGGVIRRRLLRVGLDLNQAQDYHGWLAKWGSREGHLATIDLSSASDTISYELVKMLLPEDWFYHLSAARSPRFTLGKTWVTCEKFSSMGNGFTFELESLLFWALGFGCLRELGLDPFSFSVYGDDIIIPTGAVALLKEVLSYCGFTMNPSKSFTIGPFRESCGAHYFNGVDVKPVYVDQDLVNILEVMALHNQIVLWAYRLGRRGRPWAGAVPALRVIVESVPRSSRLFGPLGLDNVFSGTFEEVRPQRPNIRNGWAAGDSFLGFMPLLTDREGDGMAVLPWKLYEGRQRQERVRVVWHRAKHTVHHRVSVCSRTVTWDLPGRATKKFQSHSYNIRDSIRSFATTRFRSFGPTYVGTWT